eukprot:Nk52_evm48s210 gene=Nk52_evmTU48s210
MSATKGFSILIRMALVALCLLSFTSAAPMDSNTTVVPMLRGGTKVYNNEVAITSQDYSGQYGLAISECEPGAHVVSAGQEFERGKVYMEKLVIRASRQKSKDTVTRAKSELNANIYQGVADKKQTTNSPAELNFAQKYRLTFHATRPDLGSCTIKCVVAQGHRDDGDENNWWFFPDSSENPQARRIGEANGELEFPCNGGLDKGYAVILQSKNRNAFTWRYRYP